MADEFFDFQVNPVHVFSLLLYRGNEELLKELRALEVKPGIAEILGGNRDYALYFPSARNRKELFSFASDFFSSALATLQVLLRTPLFEKFYEETLEQKERVRAQWLANEERALGILSDLGINIPERRPVVAISIVHESCQTGYYNSNNQTICWGHREDGEDGFSNYWTIYLCHELLHHLIVHPKEKFRWREADIIHSVIELLADNELKRRLNDEQTPPYHGIGHRGVESEIRATIFPLWESYLSKEERDIRAFIEEVTPWVLSKHPEIWE